MKESAVLSVANIACDDPPTVPHDQDPRRLLVQRIVASKSFARSPFLTSFLLYVCDRELRGKVDEISEHQIGVQALGRPEDYNPGLDNIVRNYARILRKRLDEYFEGEGKDEPLHLSIPRGGYVPVFEYIGRIEMDPAHPVDRSPAAVVAEIEDLPSLPLSTGKTSPRFFWGGVLCFLILLALAGAAIGVRYYGRSQPNLSQQFWSQIFGRGRQTLVVPADSSLGILENLTAKPVNLADYVTGSYLTESKLIPGIDARNWKDLHTQRYTSVVDLNIVLSLSHLPEFAPESAAIRYARDLRLEDLKHANAVLLGSVHTNPWVELFQEEMNFAMVYQPEVDDSFILNRHPLNGESPVYKNAWADESHRTYAVLAFLPSLDRAGNVLMLEGLNMAGTQAAADLLLNPAAMDSVLRRAQRKDGSIRPFELLLETNSIGANAPEARVIAERYSSDQRL
jgi:hypothetical protein